jgi:hypothetical protein
MKTTRQKRPDRVTISGNFVFINNGVANVVFPKSEIPNLIKALIEVVKS